MKTLICTVTAALVSALIVPGPGLAQQYPYKTVDVKAVKAEKPDSVAVIEVEYQGKPMGRIVFRFFPEVAPNHVKAFRKLANTGFYDGTTFHRVIPGFMIQGGDPNSKDNNRMNDGFGGPPYTLKAEFSNIPHTRGIVSMARGKDPNSAGSQFFICVADATHLDKQYTVFGEVLEGMDVADRITKVPKDERYNPLEKVVMKKVRIISYEEYLKSKKK